MGSLPTTRNGYKHAICCGIQADHPEWPYRVALDVACRIVNHWQA